MTILRLIFVAALASFAVANVDEVESFAEATAFVQSYTAENSGDDSSESACAKVASDSINEITNQCATLQKVVDRLAKGDKRCCAAGKAAACHAKWQKDQSQAKVDNAKKNVEAAKDQKVDFPSMRLSEMTPGKCSAFYGASYNRVKKGVKKETAKLNKVKGAHKAFTKSYNNLIKDSDKGRADCHKIAKKEFKKQLEIAKAGCSSDKNRKAFTRARHMQCVLAGKSLKGCNVGKVPSINVPTLTSVKKYCTHVGENCPAPTPVPTSTPTSAPTAHLNPAHLYWYTYGGVKMYRVHVAAKYGPLYEATNGRGEMVGVPSYIKACGAYGLKPVCDSKTSNVDTTCRLICSSAYCDWKFSDISNAQNIPKKVGHGNAQPFPVSKAAGIFWYSGPHGYGSRYNNGNQMNGRNVEKSDNNGYTVCA